MERRVGKEGRRGVGEGVWEGGWGMGLGKGVGEGLRKGWGGLGFLKLTNPVRKKTVKIPRKISLMGTSNGGVSNHYILNQDISK